jgi:hypothetical protein
MPTTLGDEFSPLWRGKYPAMLPEDQPIWSKFLDQNHSLFEKIYYNVRLGGVDPGPEQGDEKMRKAFYDVTAKRIDALCELKEEIWIVEVAFRPGLRATGQLLTYYALWLDDVKILKPAKMVLVANSIDDDLRRALEINGVLLRLVI